jgi:hypothetical protein
VNTGSFSFGICKTISAMAVQYSSVSSPVQRAAGDDASPALLCSATQAAADRLLDFGVG